MSKKSIGLLIFVFIAAAAAYAAENGVDARPRPSHAAYIEVDYADTMHGVQALHAVRSCAAEDDASDPSPIVRELPTPARLPFIHETIGTDLEDIVVRVFDNDGREVSRHVGPLDVCGYARDAAAFVTQRRSPATANARPVGRVVLAVHYGDSVAAMEGLYAVRACAYDETSEMSPELRETRDPAFDGIAVRLLDKSGDEVSHLEGTAAICSYAHFAAAYAARAQREGQKHE